MLAAVKGYYDGKQIVVAEDERKSLNIGDEVIITILDRGNKAEMDEKEVKRRNILESDAYVMTSGRSIEEIDAYIKEMRDNDRF